MGLDLGFVMGFDEMGLISGSDSEPDSSSDEDPGTAGSGFLEDEEGLILVTGGVGGVVRK